MPQWHGNSLLMLKFDNQQFFFSFNCFSFYNFFCIHKVFFAIGNVSKNQQYIHINMSALCMEKSVEPIITHKSRRNCRQEDNKDGLV